MTDAHPLPMWTIICPDHKESLERNGVECRPLDADAYAELTLQNAERVS